MKCKNCGTINSDKALKCDYCNAPLTGSMVMKEEHPPQSNLKSVICKNCKTANLIQAIKCQNCNAPLKGSMVADNTDLTNTHGHVICKNCKTNNPADALKCMNCNAPLDGSMVLSPKQKPESLKTIDKSTSAFHGNRADTKICHVCAYPNQLIATYCVKCNAQLGITESAIKTNSSQQPIPHKEGQTDMKATINPWAQVTKEFTFELIPIDAQFNTNGNPISLKNGLNNLNRENLDPENMTITSSNQMSIRMHDGKWYVSDESTMHTTFVNAGQNTEIKDGDIILAGNKLFKFSKRK